MKNYFKHSTAAEHHCANISMLMVAFTLKHCLLQTHRAASMAASTWSYFMFD